MQRRCFSRSRPASPSGAREGLAASRWWALACLLPMLLMGLFNQAPHEHEFGASTQVRARQVGVTPLQDLAWGAVSPAFGPWAAGAEPQSFRVEAAHPASGPQNACLLCQWASATDAYSLICLAFWWPLLRLNCRPRARRFRHFDAPLSLRARAPPQPSL